MGAGLQRWWRDYVQECETWSDRDVLWRVTMPNGTIVTRYVDGREIHEFDGIEARLRLWDLSSP